MAIDYDALRQEAEDAKEAALAALDSDDSEAMQEALENYRRLYAKVIKAQAAEFTQRVKDAGKMTGVTVEIQKPDGTVSTVDLGEIRESARELVDDEDWMVSSLATILGVVTDYALQLHATALKAVSGF